MEKLPNIRLYMSTLPYHKSAPAVQKMMVSLVKLIDKYEKNKNRPLLSYYYGDKIDKQAAKLEKKCLELMRS